MPKSILCYSETVNLSRPWLLVLLAVLLPIKTAMAAAMLCAPAGVGLQGELVAVQPSVARLHEHSANAGMTHEHAAHEHGSAASDNAGPGGPHDRCNICSAFCSATPLVSSLPVVLVPPVHSAALFPECSAPPPSFLSDGQERPPRTI